MFPLAVNEVFKKQLLPNLVFTILILSYGNKIGQQPSVFGFFLLSERFMFNSYLTYKDFLKKTAPYPVHYFTLLVLNYLVIMTVLAINLIILRMSPVNMIKTFTSFNILAFIGAYISNGKLVIFSKIVSRYLIRIIIAFVSYFVLRFLISYVENLIIIGLLCFSTFTLSLISFKKNKILTIQTHLI